MYICGRCFDDWPDGREECSLCGNGFRTVPFREVAQFAAITFMACSICYALVSEADTREHGEWHMRTQATA